MNGLFWAEAGRFGFQALIYIEYKILDSVFFQSASFIGISALILHSNCRPLKRKRETNNIFQAVKS